MSPSPRCAMQDVLIEAGDCGASCSKLGKYGQSQKEREEEKDTYTFENASVAWLRYLSKTAKKSQQNDPWIESY